RVFVGPRTESNHAVRVFASTSLTCSRLASEIESPTSRAAMRSVSVPVRDGGRVGGRAGVRAFCLTVLRRDILAPVGCRVGGMAGLRIPYSSNGYLVNPRSSEAFSRDRPASQSPANFRTGQPRKVPPIRRTGWPRKV